VIKQSKNLHVESSQESVLSNHSVIANPEKAVFVAMIGSTRNASQVTVFGDSFDLKLNFVRFSSNPVYNSRDFRLINRGSS
jgi:hypothetical protein